MNQTQKTKQANLYSIYDIHFQHVHRIVYIRSQLTVKEMT